jgi:hypothetical protein
MLSLPEGQRSPHAGLLPSSVSRKNTAPPRPLDDGENPTRNDLSRDSGPNRPQPCTATPRAIGVLKDGKDGEPATIALYVEVIQTLPERQSVWVRPLVLVLCDRSTEPPMPYDVRTEADLIWPSEPLRWAEDLEALPWLAALEASEMTDPERTTRRGVARSQFQAIVHRLWQAHLPSPSSSP